MDCNEDIQSDLNCFREDQEEAVFVDEELDLELPSCPMNFISNEAEAYYQEWMYKELFGNVSFTFETIPSRKWAFFQAYNKYMGDYRVLVHQREQDERNVKPGTSEMNMSAMKKQFLNKK